MENQQQSLRNMFSFRQWLVLGGVALVFLLGIGYYFLAPSDTTEHQPLNSQNSTNNINQTPTTMNIETLQEGSGEGAKTGDKVTVNYTGQLENGTVFDTSLKPGRTPFEFTLGQNRVIQGWEKGLLGMKVGEKRKLTIPSELGYGPGGNPPVIPPSATLIFEIELLKIN